MALAISDLEINEAIPIVIEDIKKYLNGEDIGTIIYSLDDKPFDDFVYDIIYILCKSSFNYEAFEMIKLILDDFEGNISNKTISDSKQLLDKSIYESDQDKCKYLYWVLNWLES